MEGKAPFSVRARLLSIYYALRGIVLMLRSQHNAWVHACATVVVVLTGIFFGLSFIEWAVLVLVLVAVWVAEALNTSFELLCDVASPEFHPLVERSKDVAAGAVLIAAFGAVVVGVLIFAPKFVSLVYSP